MASTRLVFIIRTDEMVRIGLQYKLHPYPDQTALVASESARKIMQGLPPIGYVSLYNAVIDDKRCYAYFIGASNTPLNRVNPDLIEEFHGTFNREPEEFTQGHDRWNWHCGSQKLRLVGKIMTRRGRKLTE
ncbi:hypothetical protein RhiLY_08271 [Ceratobasidium sp. AG-Ba]|nr:hypothetical protein RhiLY_08271 [Ceratobasidium sp. AG-Ba]